LLPDLSPERERFPDLFMVERMREMVSEAEREPGMLCGAGKDHRRRCRAEQGCKAEQRTIEMLKLKTEPEKLQLPQMRHLPPPES